MNTGVITTPSVAGGIPAERSEEPGRLRRPGLLYRLRLTLAALLVALLFALYLAALLGLVALVGWAVAGGDEAAGLLPEAVLIGLRVALTLFGALGILLLAKGLTRIEGRPEASQALAVDQEPDLHTLVELIAEALRAPLPARLSADCGTEIFARYQGGWRGVMSGRVELNIGLSAVAGMSVRELSGNIAHVLGTFACDAGPRRNYFVAAVNRLLARATSGGDAVEHWLERHARTRLVPFAWLARLALELCRLAREEAGWLHRQVARVSEGVLREQREFRAHCADFVSAIPTERLMHERNALREAALAAGARVRRSWEANGTVPANLPALVARTARERTDLGRGTGGAYALITCEVPSGVLFADLNHLARNASLRSYRLQFGFPVTADRLCTEPVAPFAPTAVDHFFSGCFLPLLPLGVAGTTRPRPTPAGFAGEADERIRAAYTSYRATERELIAALQGEALVDARLPVPTGQLGLDAADADSVRRRCRYLEGKLEWYAERLQAFHCERGARLVGAVLTSGSGTGPSIEARRLLRVLERTDRLLPTLAELRIQLWLIVPLTIERARHDSPALRDRIDERRADILRLLTAVRVALRNTPYPLSHAIHHSLERHAMPVRAEETTPAEAMVAIGERAVERVLAARRAALDLLVVVAAKQGAANSQ